MSNITVVDENNKKSYKISDELVFGRSANGSNIQLADENLSRSHFKILSRNNKAYIIDLESRNGTFVNEKQMPTNHAYELKNGDVIEAGEQKFSVKIKGQSPEEVKADRDLSSTVYRQEQKPIEKEAVSSIFKIEKRETSSRTPDKESEIQKYYISKEDLEHDEDEENSTYAGFFVRIIASVIDAVISGVATQILGFGFILAFPQFKNNPTIQMVFSLLVGSILGYVLIVLPLIKTGQSPGKKIMGIIVVTNDYLHPSTSHIILREFLYKYITVFFSIISLIAFLFDKKSKFIHDHLAGTRVIEVQGK